MKLKTEQTGVINPKSRYKAKMSRNFYIYVLLLPSLALVALFNLAPMKGILIAFQDYNIYNPANSEWIWFDNFIKIFKSSETMISLINTILVSFLNLIVSFPAGIIFALLLNEIRVSIFKRTIQTVSYLPHFLSWISVIGIVSTLLSKGGPINDLFVWITGNPERQMFLAKQELFLPLIILLNLWKGLGWSSIVYLAAISGVDESLYEAAALDGANRFKQVIHVTIPTILPTAVIMLIWNAGSILNSNFELIYGLQNPYIEFEVISTIMYKNGIMGGDYQMTTAFGLFQSLVNFLILITVNEFAKRTADVSVL